MYCGSDGSADEWSPDDVAELDGLSQFAIRAVLVVPVAQLD